ncbi:tetratricopeptide repeat protein, partial [Candidatus Binatia bacterium]|nr:tetratricopeptide repeat protein [Candidatus Binatia bacterium]
MKARRPRAARAVARANDATTPASARIGLAAALVGVLAIVPYLPALQAEFLTYDDDAYVSANRFVLDGLAWRSVRWAFTTFSEGNYHPLTWLSLMLDAQLWGANPIGFHLQALLLHGANAALLVLILGRVGAPPLVAAAGTLLWAVHPLRVESVAWISERKDVLSTLFGLLAVHAYLRRSQDAPDTDRVPWAAAAWMASSLACKAMFVTLPALLVLLDFWPLGRVRTLRDVARAIVRKWPLWLLSAGVGALAVVSQRSRGAMADLEALPLAVRTGNALVSYVRYVAATLWPTDLAAFYPYPVDGWPLWRPLAAAALLLAITAAVWALRARWPSLLVGWCWYAMALLPVSGVLQTGGQALADRFSYVPTIGFVLGGVGVLARLPARRVAWSAAAAAAAVVLGVLAWRQTLLWHDTVTLMEHTLAVTPTNLYAQSQLAHAYMSRGDAVRAQALFEQVLRAKPDIARVQVNLGAIAAGRGDLVGAIEHYRRGLAADPRSFEGWNNLAAALLEQGKFDDARAALEQALLLRPDDPDALFNLGMARAQAGDLAAAAEIYAKVVSSTPNDAEARYRLGALVLRLGERERGLAELRRALQLAPDHAAAAAAL